jgi:SAM-dependent methyltransferase
MPESSMLTPTRQRGFEYLDDPELAPAIAERSLHDVALANKLFGGTRAVLAEVQPVCVEARREGLTHLSLLDVGTGLADIPVSIGRLARKFGIAITPVGLEASRALARVAHKRIETAIAGDGRALPFADSSVDIVTCSQVLHHFTDADAQRLLGECSRVARRVVIVGELRRSWMAMALLWLVSFPLRFHPISRHDGMASIRRGFTARELEQVVRTAGVPHPRTHRRLGWRVTAAWNPGTSPS